MIAGALAPFLNVVPGSDGRELFISASGVGALGGTVFANIDIGPTGDKHSWTMTYSDTTQTYLATAAGFTAEQGQAGTISITTTLGLDTGAVGFYRAYVPPAAASVTFITSTDGRLRLMVSPDTFAVTTYVAVVPSFAPPAPAPAGYRFAGSVYSVRASGAQPDAAKPMILELGYDEAALAGADPHTLTIVAWNADPDRPHWVPLGGRLDTEHRSLTVATARFTTYALMAGPAWHDQFDDFGGLDAMRNVALGPQGTSLALVLSSTPGSGSAVSKPIAPMAPIATWSTLTFTSSAAPPTTTLTVDVLDMDGTVLLANVASGASLAALDPTRYPSLCLRANLSSTVAGQTPALDEWRLSWEAETYRVSLPVVLR